MIQHYGGHKDENGAASNLDDASLLARIKETIAAVKVEYAEAEKKLKVFYHDPSV
jgi:osomolarity two-component system phosphorelay intermediate protein YPD1